MGEIAAARSDPATAPGVEAIALMIDQSHNVEGKVDAMIQSVVNIQTAYAKVLLLDRGRLAAAQRAGDVFGAHRLLLDAYETDVRPLLARFRAELDLPTDPVEAFRSGHADRLAAERGTVGVENAYRHA
jgi:L-rhamnose isomerase/sugar isomerase